MEIKSRTAYEEDGRIIHDIEVDIGNKRPVSTPVHLVQYDNSLPVIAVKIYKDGYPFKLLDIYSARIRWKDPKGTIRYQAVDGRNDPDEDEYTEIYFTVDNNMTRYYGDINPILELSTENMSSGSSPIPIVIHKNPIQENDIEEEIKNVVLAPVATSGDYRDLSHRPGPILEPKFVDELPEEGESEYLYLIRSREPSQEDIFEEWVWLQIPPDDEYDWERLGTTKVHFDLEAKSGSHIGDVGTPSAVTRFNEQTQKWEIEFNYLKGETGARGPAGTYTMGDGMRLSENTLSSNRADPTISNKTFLFNPEDTIAFIKTELNNGNAKKCYNISNTYDAITKTDITNDVINGEMDNITIDNIKFLSDSKLIKSTNVTSYLIVRLTASPITQPAINKRYNYALLRLNMVVTNTTIKLVNIINGIIYNSIGSYLSNPEASAQDRIQYIEFLKEDPKRTIDGESINISNKINSLSQLTHGKKYHLHIPIGYHFDFTRSKGSARDWWSTVLDDNIMAGLKCSKIFNFKQIKDIKSIPYVDLLTYENFLFFYNPFARETLTLDGGNTQTSTEPNLIYSEGSDIDRFEIDCDFIFDEFRYPAAYSNASESDKKAYEKQFLDCISEYQDDIKLTHIYEHRLYFKSVLDNKCVICRFLATSDDKISPYGTNDYKFMMLAKEDKITPSNGMILSAEFIFPLDSIYRPINPLIYPDDYNLRGNDSYVYSMNITIFGHGMIFPNSIVSSAGLYEDDILREDVILIS